MSINQALQGIARNFAVKDICEKAKRAAADRSECMVIYFNDDNMPEFNTESWTESAEGAAYIDSDKLFMRICPDGSIDYL